MFDGKNLNKNISIKIINFIRPTKFIVIDREKKAKKNMQRIMNLGQIYETDISIDAIENNQHKNSNLFISKIAKNVDKCT